MYHKDSVKREHKTKLIKHKQYDIMASRKSTESSRIAFERKPYQIGAGNNGSCR